MASPQMRMKTRAALGRHGLAHVSGDPAFVGCVECDGDDDVGGGGNGSGGVGVWKRSGRCAVVGWTRSADHCKWSTGSRGRSSYHSPGLLGPRHPLEQEKNKSLKQDRKVSLVSLFWTGVKSVEEN